MDQYQKELSVFEKANKPRRKGGFKKYFLTFVVIVLILSAFCSGILVGLDKSLYLAGYLVDGLPNRYGQVEDKEGEIPDFLRKEVDFDIYWDAWELLQENYVEKNVPDIKLFYGSIAGMVAGLGDPYTAFFDPDTNKKFNRELQGNFDGIGAEIAIKKGQLLIVAPLPNTPAERAQIKAADKILAIDGIGTAGMSLNEAVSRIRGPRGSQVTLEIFRDGFEESKNFYIIRDKIDVKSVTLEMKDDIAYIELVHFTSETLREFNEVVQQIITKEPKGIILDLRNNPGGYLNMAIEVSSEWVEDGPIMIETGRDGTIDEYEAIDTARLSSYKTVVLINGGSASGSEIVAGALQDYDLATLVGEQTFGKGSVQDIQELKDGSAIKITIAKWLTPEGRSIDDDGISPDIEVELTNEDFDNDRDPQLDRALELLKESN